MNKLFLFLWLPLTIISSELADQSDVWTTSIALGEGQPLRIPVESEDSLKQRRGEKQPEIHFTESLPSQILPLNIPEFGRKSKYFVPFNIVREVALKRAKGMWPKAKEGPIIPYVDYEGKTAAYMFHFRIDGKPFPADYAQVAKEGLNDITFRKFRYAHLLISARYDRTPIIAYGEGLSEFYYTGWKARKKAKEILLISNPKLKRIYFTRPISWFEFEGKKKTIVIHSNLLSQWSKTSEFVERIRKGEKEALKEAEIRAKKEGKTLKEMEQELFKKSKQEWDEARDASKKK